MKRKRRERIEKRGNRKERRRGEKRSMRDRAVGEM